jgi:DNA-binding MarR family transcriptional regulator
MQSLSDATKLTPVDECAWELLDAVPPLIWFIRRQMRSQRKGLSVPQFRALARVEKQPSASLSVVADHLGVSLPTASRIVGGLVTKGLVRRTGCPQDRRQLSLIITARGQAVRTAAWRATQDQLAREVQRFTPAQRATVSQAMRILKKTFGSLVRPGAPHSSADDHATCAARLAVKRRRVRA